MLEKARHVDPREGVTIETPSDNPLQKRRWRIPPELAGARLDRALCQLEPGLTRTHAKELILSGHVTLDGVGGLKPSLELTRGATLEVTFAPRRSRRLESGDASQLRVLLEDEALVVIDKPAGVLAHPTDTTSGATISDLAALRYGVLPALQGADRPGIVHRLDAGTSGVMVLARTKEAFADLMQQFRNREVRKTYLALVYGEPRFDTGWVDAKLARASGDTSRMAIASTGEGREAQTYYEVRERFRGLALLAVEPKTGRTHQIRVHLTSVGMPLVGDRLYKRRGGHSIQLPDDAPVPARQCLHAWRLRFRHPSTQLETEVEAPLADDFQRMLDWARASWPLSP
jgi:23S rRNA pseudouridine1911/1915/1917 synthase